jgi:predicted alpha/beta-hydrolase family hydrolase
MRYTEDALGLSADEPVELKFDAGAPMDSPSLKATAKTLEGSGFRVARFEFGHVAGQRTGTGRKPPPRAETLNPEYLAAVDALGAKGPLFIGRKSMGGRVDSMSVSPHAGMSRPIRSSFQHIQEARELSARRRRAAL